MKLEAIRNVITSKVGRQILTVQKNSPTLLFAAGVVGVVGTVVLASRATLKLDEILQDTEKKVELARTFEHEQYSEQDRRNDLVLIYIKTAGRVLRMYAPAIVLGGLSIAALTGSHVILSRRNVAITAAYAALDRGFKNYRGKVVKALGADQDREFMYEMEGVTIVEEGENGPETRTVLQPTKNTHSIYGRYFDESSDNWNHQWNVNSTFIRCQQNWANDMLQARGHLFLNEVYDMLGLTRTRAGAVVGWVKGHGDGYVDFGIFQGDLFSAQRFINGHERSIFLDFNVDGIIYDIIEEKP